MNSFIARLDENYNYCIYKNNDLIFIAHADLGKRYFTRKVEDLRTAGHFVDDQTR